MRALVIDDEQLVLEGLEALLQAALPDISLDKAAALDVALRLAATVDYEVVLLDWNLMAGDGRRVDARGVLQALRASGSTAPVVVISGDDSLDWPHLLQELGLSGFVPKSAPGAVLLDAIGVAQRGGFYLPARWASTRLTAEAHAVRAPRRTPAFEPKARFPELTERQCEVFAGMARGLSDKQIGRELEISESTVKTHVRAIMDVVGVRRRGEAVFEVSGGSGPSRG